MDENDFFNKIIDFNIKKNEELFEKFILCFSRYINISNSEYKYNLGYLESYYEKINQFNDRFMLKNKLFDKVIKEVNKYSLKSNAYLIIKMDSCWTYDGIERKLSQLNNVNVNLIENKFCFFELEYIDDDIKEIDAFEYNINSECNELYNKIRSVYERKRFVRM